MPRIEALRLRGFTPDLKVSGVNQPARPAAAAPGPVRLASIDAYRGLVMLLMMGEVLHFCRVAGAYPANGFWKFLCYHQTHVEWVGCSLHDLIQPWRDNVAEAIR